ncbi:MAG: hypothetical protein ACJA2S_004830 [Cyclobacteriaceae bacterium]|jgi:hypothetical protein
MIAKYIWCFGSLIFTILGSIHLYYTFFSNKFSSKNEKALEEMKTSHPLISKETTLWKAWGGFNASHSSGTIFIGIMNIYIISNFYTTVKNDILFFLFNIVTVGFYLWLAKRYWFKAPFFGILLTLICFLTSFALTFIN